MSIDSTVWILVPVQVPPGNKELDVVKYVNDFINIGLLDLQESVDDPDIDSSEDDEVVAKQCVFLQPLLEKKF